MFSKRDENGGLTVIQSKDDFHFFLSADKAALFIDKKHPGILDDIWKFERLLRKTEYYCNCRKDIVGRAYYMILRLIYHHKSIRLGFSIPLNVCEAGLSIAHYGNVTINKNAHIGKNCRIYNGVVIGSKGFGGGPLLLVIMS